MHLTNKMKPYRILLILKIFLFSNFIVFGQQSIGVKVNGGLSRFSGNLYDHTFGTQKTFFAPSGQVGLFYNLPMRTNELFGVELLFTQIEGKNQVIDTVGSFTANGNTTKWINKTTISRHISYLSLPICYGIKLGKFTISVGLQISLALMSSGQATIQTNFDYATQTLGTFTSSSTTNKLYIKDGAFGQTVAIVYNLNSKFSLEGNYYYGLSNIYRKPISGATEVIWKFQQMTIGLRYAFLNIKKSESK